MPKQKKQEGKKFLGAEMEAKENGVLATKQRMCKNGIR